MYSAVAAAALRRSVGIVSDIGADHIGGYFARLLGMGVDMRGVRSHSSSGVRYEILNCDEVVPQFASKTGGSSSPIQPSAVPREYLSAKALLLYPYDPSLMVSLAEEVRANGGRIYLDLQHDVQTLAELSPLLPHIDVVLASHEELLGITSKDTAKEAAGHVSSKGPTQVIVKFGLGGSQIFKADGSVENVPAHLAEFKCTVGAGDIYNAVYAVLESQGLEASAAASHASLAAAVFSEHVDLDEYYAALSDPNLLTQGASRTRVFLPPDLSGQVRLYLAGNFLSAPMRNWVEYTATVLESRGFSVFVPHRDAGILSSGSSASDRNRAFQHDIREIREASAVVALLDGSKSGGTSWEIGYAYSLGVPIIGLATSESASVSNMVEESCEAIVGSHPLLLNQLYELVADGSIPPKH
jgi:sugar/nucleoside kinase (ribokinase family)/nucleoside 2-deoxyribosyltransferase